MSEMYIDVDTAVTVIVNKMPLTDDTDFKSREIAIAYNQAGMDLVWNFTTSAGVVTQTAVTPTTAGVYDWTHVGDAVYKIEIPASGGASINNDTEGYGYFSGICTGVLPWVSPIYTFRAAALNDAMVDGGDNLDVNTVQVSGTAQTANDNGADINAILADTADMQPRVATIEADTTTDIPALIATAQDDLDIITGADGAALASTQQSITFQPITVTAGDGIPNIELTGTGSADGLEFSRSGAGGLFDTNWAAAIESEVTDALTAYAPATEAKQDAQDAIITEARLAELDAANLPDVIDAILAMLDDPRAEPAQGAPAANADMATKLDYLYKAWRNKTEQTATTLSVYNDAGTVVDHKAAVSDDTTTATNGEIVSGP